MKKIYKFGCFIILIILSICNNPILFSQTNKTIEEKQKHIDSVRDKIWQTINIPYPKPYIKLFPSRLDNSTDDLFLKTTACWFPRTDSIFIGIDIYDLCMTIGEEALAGVLAHEIGHYFNQHNRCASVSGYIISTNEFGFIKSNINQENYNVYNGAETQADIFAAFHCYSAGYDIQSAMPEILDKIYKLCKTPDTSENYIPLAERQKIARSAKEKFKKLIPIFDAAIYFLITGDYILSANCFELIISNDYMSWDIYNNAGVGYALEGLKYFPKNFHKFVYPFEFESNSELTKLSESSGITTKGLMEKPKDSISYRNDMIRNAIDYFKTTLLMNYNLIIPYINLSCLYEIKGSYKEARSYAFLAESKIKDYDTHTKNLINNIKGIIYYSEKDTNAAKKEFKGARNSELAKYNLKKLNGENIDGSSNKNHKEETEKRKRGNEQIAQTDMGNFDYPKSRFENNSIRINSDTLHELEKLFISTWNGENFKALKAENDKGTMFIIETKNNYKDTTLQGIKIGNSKLMVIEKYGYPIRIQAGSSYEYLIYEKPGIIFKIDTGYVAGWILYKQSEN